MKGSAAPQTSLRTLRVLALGLLVSALSAGAQPQQVIVNGRVIQLSQTIHGPAANTALSLRDSVRFLDGSRLRGKLEGIETNRLIRWSCPDAAQELQFTSDNLDRIRFAQPQPSAAKFRNRVALANGDEIPGTIASLDWNRLVIDTAFAGAVSVARSNVQSILFLPKDYRVAFEGPVNGLDWTTVPPGSWDYRDGVFASGGSGALSADAQLAESATLEFSLAWADHFSLMIGLFLEKGAFDPGGCAFTITLSNDRASAQELRKSGPPADLGNAAIAATGKNRMRVAIQCNQAEKALSLFIDGQPVRRWKTDTGFAGKGTRALFSDRTGTAGLELGDVRVSCWNGPEPALASASLTNADSVSLINRDAAPGKILNIGPVNLEFQIGGRTLQIPLERVARIDFAAPVSANPAAPLGGVRALVSGGTWISFDMDLWNPAGAISGRSALFGAIQLPVAIVRELQFNPGQPRRPGAPASGDEFGGLDE